MIKLSTNNPLRSTCVVEEPLYPQTDLVEGIEIRLRYK